MVDVDLGGSPLGAWAAGQSNGVAKPATRLAWQYLLPDHPMTRRVDTHEIYSARRWQVAMEVDFSVPPPLPGAVPAVNEKCLVPVAFLARRRVAHDLEVRNGAGELVSAPTMQGNMDLTAQALAEISAGAAAAFNRPPADYHLEPDLLTLAGDLMRAESHHARICRFEIEDKMECGAFTWLLPLLRRLEDYYMLWVPVEGDPGSLHHLSIRRSEWRWLDLIFEKKRRREVELKVPTSLGEIQATWDPPYKRRRKLWPNLPAAVGRLLIACGLMPVTLRDEAYEAHRFSSYHACVSSPPGFILRELRAGRIEETEWEAVKPVIKDIQSGLNRTISGEDSRIGHIHLATARNPSRLYTRATVGLRPETITLWALVALFTCGLLWAFHRNVQAIAELSDKAQVAIGVLLIGPTFASAWTLREKDRALMRSTLSGTRLLMLSSAALSVATVLALTDLRPFGWEVGPAVSWYASFSYTIAAFIIVAWLQTRSLAWFAFRHVLTKPKWNQLAILILAAISYLTLWKIEGSAAVCTGVLVLTGLSLTVVAANRTSNPLGEVSHLPSFLAGIAAIVTLAIASREMTFYNQVVDRSQARELGMTAELGLMAAAILLLLSRYCLRLYRRNRAAKHEKSLQNPPTQSSQP